MFLQSFVCLYIMYIASKWVSMLRTLYIRHMCIHIKSICTEGLREFISSIVVSFYIFICTSYAHLFISSTTTRYVYITNTNWHYNDIHKHYIRTNMILFYTCKNISYTCKNIHIHIISYHITTKHKQITILYL